MQIINQANLSTLQLLTLAQQLPEHQSLFQLMTWLKQPSKITPAPEIIDVISQDEFTNDVLLNWSEGLVLVYAAT